MGEMMLWWRQAQTTAGCLFSPRPPGSASGRQAGGWVCGCVGGWCAGRAGRGLGSHAHQPISQSASKAPPSVCAACCSRRCGCCLCRVLSADEDVANAVQAHPHLPVLATSGIENTVKASKHAQLQACQLHTCCCACCSAGLLGRHLLPLVCLAALHALRLLLPSLPPFLCLGLPADRVAAAACLPACLPAGVVS